MPASFTKRVTVVVTLLVAAAVAGAALLFYRWHRPFPGPKIGTAPEILTQLPGDAPIIAYIDVAALRRLQGSPLASMLGLAGQNPNEDRDYENFVRGTGFDYTRDLDQVAVAFWPSASPKTRPEAADNRALAIAEGRFDESKIKAYALQSGTVVTAGNRSLYIVPGHPAVALEFLRPTRLALASGPDPAQVLSQASPPAQNAVIEDRIHRVAGAPLFVVAEADHLPASLYESLRGAPQFQNVARSVRGLMLAGQPDGDLIHLTLDAECDSMTSAVELATVIDSLRLLGSIALADPKTRRHMTQQQAAFLTALLEQAKLSHQDRWVRLTLDVTPAMLGQGERSDAGWSSLERILE